MRRPRRVLAAAGAVFAIAAVFGAPVTGSLGSSIQDFESPGSQYERANAAITAATGQSAYYDMTALVTARRDIATDAQAQRALARLAAMLAAQHGFQRALGYGGAGADSRSPALLSRDRRQTVVLAAFARERDATTAISRVRAALARPPARAAFAGTSVRFGGSALVNEELNERTTRDLARAELIALPILLALSFWFFRGLVAALLPPLVGGLAILLTFLALRVIDRFTPISVFSLNLVSGMGLGLGIDYSLFMVYRYREELAGGASAAEAIERTLRTVGRTVLFSCLTVAAAMTSLLVFPLRFLYSMGVGGAIVALCGGAVALLLLPALLIVLGPRIDALSPAWLQRRAARSATAAGHDGGGWWRLARGVVRRPAAVALASAAVLLVLATPVLHLRFTSPGGSLLPASAESRRVESALAASFPANLAEATEIVVPGPRSRGGRASSSVSPGTDATVRRLARAAARAAGRSASVAAPVSLGHGTAVIALLPRGSPFSSVQQRLLARLRALARPYGALVGGATAFFVDQKGTIAASIPLALLILLSLTAAFVFAMTGSLTIPLKALLMNALSVSVGAGLIVWIFQDGHLSSVLGFAPIGGLEESSLVLMLVVAFALATDYEVFVLARVKEAHDAGLPNREAIALGLERTGRIVTAAALLFCVAIGALATSELFFTKQLGVGAALTVAIDASVIRALLVPALMALMGDWNWWAPAPLRRLHDRFAPRERT
ncbi:MAG TPA: MMPL family transporter [Solirubrobacteraceae bacterium]|nr:MMPL family transporter [Solirubrobacteraceae bacterium]